MNPNALNPFGLEDRTLTFHVLINGQEQYDDGWPKQSTNRLYCWAQFPKYIRDAWGYYWSTEMVSTPEEYDDLKQYMSVKMEDMNEVVMSNGTRVNPDKYWGTEEEGNLSMVMGNQDYYVQRWYDFKSPEYATIFVLDTSGSMSGDATKIITDSTNNDYASAVNQITSILSEYTDSSKSDKEEKVWIYSGTYLDNLTSACLGSRKYISNSISDIHKSIQKLIKSITKYGSSEAMITCLYKAIVEMQANLLRKKYYTSSSNSIYYANSTGGDDDVSNLRAMTFCLMTDESIFTSDTLQDFANLKKEESKNWFGKIQSGSVSFPESRYGKKEMIVEINNVLKCMSYFHGVNITWSLCQCWDSSRNDWSDTDKIIPLARWAILNETSTLTYVTQGSGIWNMPSSFHVAQPFTYMAMIILDFSAASGTGWGINLVSSKKMLTSDQYLSESTIKNKFHIIHGSSNKKYCAFRYFSNGAVSDPINLPGTGNMEITGLTGRTYRLGWFHFSGTNNGNKCGGGYLGGSDISYTPNSADVQNEVRIMFQLRVEFPYTVTFDVNGGVQPSTWTSNTKQIYGGNMVGEAPEPSPTRPGFNFIGWFTSTVGGEEFNSGKVVNSDLTFYAQWEEIPEPEPDPEIPPPITYTVKWNSNGGTSVGDWIGLSSGTTLGGYSPTLPTSTRGGHTFVGWFTTLTGGTQISTSTPVTGDVTYYAHWNPIPVVPENITVTISGTIGE